MPQPAPRPGSALFERLFGRPPEAEAEEAKLRTLFELLGATLDTRGKDYLSALAAHLTDLLRIELCLITRVDESEADQVKIIAMARRGEAGPSGSNYVIRDTPCEMVVQGVEYFVPDGVAEAFPKDTALAEGGYRSYFGVPIWGDQDEVIGKICLLDTDPLPDAALAREVVGMFTQRVSAELIRVRAREEARVADETLQRFVQDFPGWVCAYETSEEGEGRHILFSSEQGAALIGPRNLAMLEEDATRFNTLLHPEERQHVEAVYAEARETNGNYDLEYRIRQDDGRYRWVQATGCFNRMDDGRCVGHSFMLDRDSYRRLEQQHEALLHEMHTLVGAIPDSVILQDGKGRVRFLNAAAEELFGLHATSLIGQDFATLAEEHPQFGQIFQTAHANTLAALEGKKRVDSRVRRILPYEVEARAFETTRIPVLDEDETPTALVTIVRDVTARETARTQAEELRALEARAARLAALSRLVDGVTHEFENQLTAVLGYSELGEARVRQLSKEDTEVLARSFHRIREAAQNASELTRNLQAFGSSRGVGGTTCSPWQVIQERSSAWQERFGLQRDFLIDAEADDLQGLQISLSATGVVNLAERLLVNAYEATAPGGSITLRLTRRQLSDETRDQIELVVSDDGRGIPHHLRERVFDPLFSTHEDTSRRRGMGLAVVHNLALCADGSIRLASTGEAGTTFVVQLPCAELPAASDEGSKEAPSILLIDDQEGTRELMQEVLRAAGYEVTACGSCADARACAQTLAEPHLILIDVFLEDGLGTELVAELQEQWPGAKALFCSGMPVEHLEQQGIRLPTGNPMLKKPFRPTELISSVREVLGAPDLAPSY